MILTFIFMKNRRLLCFVLFTLACLFSLSGQPYNNQNLTSEERLTDLLSRMTLEEKIGQLTMKPLRLLKFDAQGNVSDSSLTHLFEGQGIGCLESPFIEHSKIAKLAEAADNYLRTKTRLGIPAILVAECLHGQMALGATIFPQAIGLGSTWNPVLIQKMAGTIAHEATLSGVDQALAPVIDLARDPRFGRVEECFGEDPYLVKEFGNAYIRGMQGDPELTRKEISPDKLICAAKHFVAYSAAMAGINLAPVSIGDRALRETYLYPFEAAVKEANIYGIMPGYHEFDGIPMHSNKHLLTDILRKELGFKGYIFSDYSAVEMLYSFHQTAETKKDAARQALVAGVDLEAPVNATFKELVSLVKEGEISTSLIDSAVIRVLRVKFKSGLFDRPFKIKNNLSDSVHTKAGIALSQQIAEESIVLLKNEKKLLPLHKDSIMSIAVIGPNADKVQFGDYSITKNNAYGITTLQGIKEYVGDKITVNYAEGCGITNLSKAGFPEAIAAANASDVVVLVMGGTSIIYSGIGWGDQNSKELNTCGEGYDRNELNFPGIQSELIAEVCKTGKPVILVMINGRPYTIGREANMVSSVLEAWYPGERGGSAIARILFGEVNPSGRLSVSFPQSPGHIPVTSDHKPSARGYYHKPGSIDKPGRDYVFASTDPLYCFGFGLSYTTFKYENLHIENNIANHSETVDVSCLLTNTGDCAGAEVVQLYVKDKVSSVTTPVRSLKAFRKVYLKKGQTVEVNLQIQKKDLMIWDINMNRVLEEGTFEIYLGSSSEEIKLTGNFEIKL